MSYRLTITAAIAVFLASFSLLTVIEGTGWLYAGAGAVVVVAAAGLATRLAPIPAAVAATALVLVASVPLLAWPSWPVRIAGLAAIAIMAASAGSRTVLPALADVGTYLAALLIYLNVVFAGPQSVAWVIPTVKSLRHLSHLASIGYAEHNYAPPVPGIHGIELIAAAGIGGAAILTDVLAVRMRTPAVAGLPLLVLFSVPVATNVKHVGAGLTLAFCTGITGYLALLAADGRERLRLWGRLVTVWQDLPGDEGDHAPDTRALAASGRRIGLAAVAVAVVLPLALPGLKEHGLLGKTPVPGHGTAVIAPPAPLVQMRSQLFNHSDRAFLTYRTTAPDPPEQYLQVYVLNYNSHQDGWTLTNRTPSTAVGNAALRPAPGLASNTDFTSTRTTVTIGKSSGYTGQMNYLPLPYAPQFLTVPGNGWQETRSTLMVYGYRPDASLTYTVQTETANPTLTQLSTKTRLPASITDDYGTYTGPDRKRLLKIARQVTAGATTPFTKAEALEGYFTDSGKFTYSLAGSGAGSVLEFLTTDRQGFCQQFAFSMAVLARLIGIPSRIAVGYTAGVPIGHHTWKVTTADAHAWPELYFAGAGWLRFEPTPGGPAAQGTATTPIYAGPDTGAAPTTNPPAGSTGVLPVPSTGPNGRAAQIHKPTSELAPNGSQINAVQSGSFPVGPVVGLIVLVLLVAPGLSRLVIRRRRWLTATGDAGRAHAAWRELGSDLVDHGLAGARSESPRALARRIASPGDLNEPAREAVHRLAAAEERARYARTPASAGALKSDVQVVRRAIAQDATAGQRWRARLMPASILGPVLAALRQAPDLFGWLDAAGAGVRRTVSQTLRRAD